MREEVTTTSDVIHLRPRKRRLVESDYLDIQEAARRLGVSERTLRRHVHNGTVPHVYLGPNGGPPLRFPADLLDDWLRKRMEGVV